MSTDSTRSERVHYFDSCSLRWGWSKPYWSLHYCTLFNWTRYNTRTHLMASLLDNGVMDSWYWQSSHVAALLHLSSFRGLELLDPSWLQRWQTALCKPRIYSRRWWSAAVQREKMTWSSRERRSEKRTNPLPSDCTWRLAHCLQTWYKGNTSSTTPSSTVVTETFLSIAVS